MRKMTPLLFAASAVLSQFVCAGEKSTPELGQWNKVQADYMIHSGSATYAEPPTNNDRALTVHFEGVAAKQVFDQIGPDASVKCSPEKRDRERRKKGVTCIYTDHLNDPKDFHYTCWVGVNLRTGDGDVRVAC